jgi:inner membrane protein involved in colicin E2 resistance
MLLFKKIFLTSSLLITPVLIIPFIIQQVTNSNNHKSDVSENTQAYNFTLGQQFSVDGDNLFAQK